MAVKKHSDNFQQQKFWNSLECFEISVLTLSWKSFGSVNRSTIFSSPRLFLSTQYIPLWTFSRRLKKVATTLLSTSISSFPQRTIQIDFAKEHFITGNVHFNIRIFTWLLLIKHSSSRLHSIAIHSLNIKLATSYCSAPFHLLNKKGRYSVIFNVKDFCFFNL